MFRCENIISIFFCRTRLFLTTRYLYSLPSTTTHYPPTYYLLYRSIILYSADILPLVAVPLQLHLRLLPGPDSPLARLLKNVTEGLYWSRSCFYEPFLSVCPSDNFPTDYIILSKSEVSASFLNCLS